MSNIVLLSSRIPDLLPMHRSPGMHVSEIIADICIRHGYLIESNTIDYTKWALGCALERSLASMFALDSPGSYIYNTEVELDNIYGHPDLICLTDYAIEEIKLTWRSSRHPIESDKFFKEWAQIKAYCKMIGSNIGRLHIVHVDGDYNKDYSKRQSIYRCWQANFEEEEIDDNWQMILSHGERLERLKDQRKKGR